MGATLQSGKYQLNQVLGRESLGATYLATQTLLQQPVVIKTIDPSLQITQSFPQLKTRFTEETRLLARCQHPSVVRVLDFFQEDGLPFLVMEYIPGQTLYDRISTQNAPSLTEAEAIHYMRQIASALSVAHRNGLIHRNIRPETIVRRQGTNLGTLVGFGFAHDVAVTNPIEKNPFVPSDPNWSRDSRFAIDLYSLAATLYFLLTGQPPNDSLSLEQYPWSPATKQAIFRGLTRDSQWQLQTVDDWLRLLPNTTLPLMAVNNIVQSVPPASNPAPSQNGRIRSPEPELLTPFPVQRATTPPAKAPTIQPAPIPAAKLPTAPVQTAPSPVVISSPRPRLPKSLTLTIATAGAIGLGFGLALRISAARTPETTLLQPIQSFSEKEWKGTINPSDNNLSDIPLESGSAKSDKVPQKFIDPEVDRPKYVAPKVEPSPEYIRPRRQLSEPIKPVQPTPAVEPTQTAPEPDTESVITPAVEPIVPPVTAPTPVPIPVNPAPVKPSTREVAPTPPLPSTP
jgi:serine/threonine-protein kinase